MAGLFGADLFGHAMDAVLPVYGGDVVIALRLGRRDDLLFIASRAALSDAQTKVALSQSNASSVSSNRSNMNPRDAASVSTTGLIARPRWPT